jgi:hypothetical protein
MAQKIPHSCIKPFWVFRMVGWIMVQVSNTNCKDVFMFKVCQEGRVGWYNRWTTFDSIN